MRFEPGVRSRSGFFAGSDERRAEELASALRCKEARAIVIARGGHGCTRLLERVDFAPLARDPKWLVGFSDVTALHAMAQHWGVRSLHAHNVTGLGLADDDARNEWLAALCEAPRPRRLTLQRFYPGDVRGPLFGGNLAALCATLRGSRPRPPKGAILFLEDVGEAPYRVDRMLVEVERMGLFDDAVGVATGYFTPARPETRDVLASTARRLRLPWLDGVPSGHERPNTPLELGARAALVGDRLIVGE